MLSGFRKPSSPESSSPFPGKRGDKNDCWGFIRIQSSASARVRMRMRKKRVLLVDLQVGQ